MHVSGIEPNRIGADCFDSRKSSIPVLWVLKLSVCSSNLCGLRLLVFLYFILPYVSQFFCREKQPSIHQKACMQNKSNRNAKEIGMIKAVKEGLLRHLKWCIFLETDLRVGKADSWVPEEPTEMPISWEKASIFFLFKFSLCISEVSILRNCLNF